jgi:hypothetical protein
LIEFGLKLGEMEWNWLTNWAGTEEECVHEQMGGRGGAPNGFTRLPASYLFESREILVIYQCSLASIHDNGMAIRAMALLGGRLIQFNLGMVFF